MRKVRMTKSGIRKRIVRIFSLLAVSALLGCTGLSAFAAAGSKVDWSMSGSSSIRLVLTDDSGNAVTGGSFILYEVASTVQEDEDIVYSYSDDFTFCGMALNERNTSLAAELAEYVSENNIDGTVETAGADGIVCFEGLEFGLYLIVQTETSAAYYRTSPFLVSVPYEEADGSWVYNVNASPKVEVCQTTEDTDATDETEEPDESDETDTIGDSDESDGTDSSDESAVSTLPQTGQLNWPVPVLAVGGVLLLIAGRRLTAEKRKK